MKRKFKNVEITNDENNKQERVSSTEVLSVQSKTSTIKKKKRSKNGKNIEFIDTDQLTNSFSNVESSEKETEGKNNWDEEETEQLESTELHTSICKKQKKPKRKEKEDLNGSEHDPSKQQKKAKQSEDNFSTESDQEQANGNMKKRKKKEQKMNVDSSHQSSECTEPGEEIESKKQEIEDGLYEPTETELNECQNPENIKQTKVSIRQQKREKNRKRLMEQKEKSEVATQKKVLKYLSEWKLNRDQWKFEKLKQIWLFNNIFDENKIPDNKWEIAIEYINGSKGKARQSLLESAMKIIHKAEEQTETEQIEEDSNYKRARNLLQRLQE